MINFDAVDFSERLAEEVMFLLTLSVLCVLVCRIATMYLYLKLKLIAKVYAQTCM